MSEIQKNSVYDNIKMIDRDGNELSFVDRRRANWYLKKEIAVLVEKDGKNYLQLKFDPSGRRISNLSMAQRENKCVVCGIETNLTKHHVIPSCFRTHMEFKEYCSHDILPICRNCHDKYEEVATVLKNELVNKYVPDFWGHNRETVIRDLSKAKRCWSLINKETSNVPYERFSLAVDFIYQFESKYNKKIHKLLNFTPDFYRMVVKRYNNEHSFCVFWRQHFMDVAKPQFMPKDWDVNFNNESIFLENEKLMKS